jgi:hypothetical protein
MRSIALVFFAAGLFAADRDPSPAEIDTIIQKFAAKESQFAKARENYMYKQSARIQEFDDAGNPGGRWEEVSEIMFPEGKRAERVIRAPVQNLRMIVMTPEDLEDIRKVQPFVLTTTELPNYTITYLGRQAVDEIGTYVFAVRPKKMEPGKRYFAGQVWVDDRDLQIVKSYGRATGILKGSKDQQFPKFETYREQIDGKYWFPTYTIANDTLHFKENDVRIKQTIRYEDYKQFKAESTISFGDEVKDEKKPDPAKPPIKKQ